MVTTSRFAPDPASLGRPRALRPVRGVAAEALALVLAGVGFTLYPAIRPFSDEASLSGAGAFASARWLVAHSIAMGAFVALAAGVSGVVRALSGGAGASLAGAGRALTWLGLASILPYYGAETFGLHAVGQVSLQRGDPALLSALSDRIRWQEGIAFLVGGLLLIAVGIALVAAAAVRSGRVPSSAAVPLAVGLALYLPQFAGSQPVRVAHGLLLTAACCWLAWNLGRVSDPGRSGRGR